MNDNFSRHVTVNESSNSVRILVENSNQDEQNGILLFLSSIILFGLFVLGHLIVSFLSSASGNSDLDNGTPFIVIILLVIAIHLLFSLRNLIWNYTGKEIFEVNANGLTVITSVFGMEFEKEFKRDRIDYLQVIKPTVLTVLPQGRFKNATYIQLNGRINLKLKYKFVKNYGLGITYEQAVEIVDIILQKLDIN